MMPRQSLQVVVAFAFLSLGWVGNADAQFGGNPVNIFSAEINPTGTITPTDPVSLDVLLVSGSASINLYAPTQVDFFDDPDLGLEKFFFVSIFAQTGLLAIPDQRHEIASLGTLAPGTYSYLVIQNGPSNGADASGTFTVVPEPATSLLLGVALMITATRRRS